MSMDFSISHGSIEIYQSIPDDLKSFRIASASGCQYIQTDFLKYFTHVFPGNGCIGYYTDGIAHENGYMGAREDRAMLEVRYVMEGRLTGFWDGIPDADLAEGRFNVSHTAHVHTKAKFNKGQRVVAFDIHADRKFLERYSAVHPQMGYFLEAVDKGEPVQLLPHSFPAPWRMRKAVEEIIYCPYTGQLAQDNNDAQMKIIMACALQTALFPVSQKKEMVLLPHYEQTMLRAVDIIKTNREKPYTVKELCAKLKMSEKVLYDSFWHWANQTPRDYQVMLKMKEAARDLRETDENISIIGAQAGYNHSSSFTREFLKWYDYTPEEFREMKR